jgi:CheY-like chemotaxis protein
MSALRKVLVVDDDPVVGSSFNRVLSHEGYIVVTARNGAEALDKLNEGEYDVVYTDIKMPGMDGLELAERVKARRSWTPVVIITGYGTEANETRAKAAGVTAFLHKPLSPEMIETSAKDALEATPDEAVSVAPATGLAVEAPEVATPDSGWKTAAMMVAGPLIGLAYVVLLPFVGLVLLAGIGLRAFVKAGGPRRTLTFVKDVALFVAAPFLGLAYIVLLPFVGLGAFLWMGLREVAKKERHS